MSKPNNPSTGKPAKKDADERQASEQRRQAGKQDTAPANEQSADPESEFTVEQTRRDKQ